jgi:1-acyl-sn-glycerol-3-phosphate acyltransferase
VDHRTAGFDYRKVAYTDWPPVQRASRRILIGVFRTLVRIRVDGMEHLPVGGPYILVANHLHALDPAIGLLLVPRRVVGVAKDKWDRPPYRWLLRAMSDVVFIGASNRTALDALRRELDAGGVVAILPEGTRSRSGAMGEGRRGFAALAARAQVRVVPAAAHGQERSRAFWHRGRRVPVHVHIGPPLPPPPLGAGKTELARYTDEVMRAIASLLPERYRGVYGPGSVGPNPRT